jgi:hypothetical protein
MAWVKENMYEPEYQKNNEKPQVVSSEKAVE